MLDHLQFFDPLSPPEKASLTAKMIRRHFQTGDQLVAQGEKNEAFHFVFAGVIQVAHQLPDGRTLDEQSLGPGDAYGQLSILTGIPSPGTFSALTGGLLLELRAEDLKPIIEARPKLMEALSHYVAKMQQFLARFERSALEPVVIEQHDMLWRIKNFFGLDEVNGVNNTIRHARRRNESESDRK